MSNDSQQPFLSENEKEAILHLYDHMEERKKDFSQKQWEGMKYFTTLISALITVVIGGVIANYQFCWQLGIGGRILLKSLLLTLSSGLVFISFLGLINLRRETERLMQTIAVLSKIEEYLGLHHEVQQDKRYFQGNKHIVLEKWLSDKCGYPTDEKWIVKEMSKSFDPTKRGLASLSWVFYVLILLTCGLFLLLLTMLR